MAGLGDGVFVGLPVRWWMGCRLGCWVPSQVLGWGVWGDFGWFSKGLMFELLVAVVCTGIAGFSRMCIPLQVVKA